MNILYYYSGKSNKLLNLIGHNLAPGLQVSTSLVRMNWICWIKRLGLNVTITIRIECYYFLDCQTKFKNLIRRIVLK